MSSLVERHARPEKLYRLMTLDHLLSFTLYCTPSCFLTCNIGRGNVSLEYIFDPRADAADFLSSAVHEN